MGVIIMRMDMEPPLFTLAVTLTIDRNGEGMQEYSVFLTACKTIEELQEYVNRKVFRDDMITHFDNGLMYTDNQLQKIAHSAQEQKK